MSSLGRHILVEYYGCDRELLNDVVQLEQVMVAAAREANATVINSTFHYFSPFGASGVVVIQESHLAIHTWPEYGYAAVDIFTCGETVDPWVSHRYLEEKLGADHASAVEKQRGDTSELSRLPVADVERRAEVIEGFRSNRDLWFTERNQDIALSLRHKGDRLYHAHSPYQKIEVYDTHAYGRLLTLDGLIMTSEKDEYVYHEMISHIPMQAHPHPERILVIGGGDGGVIRELLRYPSVKRVDLVEIDAMVIEAARQFLPGIATTFEHEKLQVHIGDGVSFVKEATASAYDVVIVDAPNPVGPAGALQAASFFAEIHRILGEDGILMTQSESPKFNPEVFREIFSTCTQTFGEGQVHCCLVYIPTYPTGMWSLAFASKGKCTPLQNLDEESIDRFALAQDLKYYNASIHRAAFALPGFVRKTLNQVMHERRG